MRIKVPVILLAATIMLLAAGCAEQLRKQAAIDHYVEGRLLIEQGSLDAALAELAAAIKNDPTLSIAYSTTGDIHRQRGDWKLARTSYETACETNPYSFKPHYNLGLTYQMLANVAATSRSVEEFLRLAVQVYLRANTIEPDDFETNLNLSACYFQLGKYEQAEQYCTEAISIDPSNPNTYSNLGIICDSQNRLYDAIKAYKASLEIDTHQPKLLLNLGSTYMRQNRLKRAMKAFTLAAEEAPDDPAAWEQIGSCHYRMGNYGDALVAYEKSISLDANRASTHRGLGVVYMTQYVLDQGQTELRDRAVASWHTSLELKPQQDDLAALVKKYAVKYTGPQL